LYRELIWKIVEGFNEAQEQGLIDDFNKILQRKGIVLKVTTTTVEFKFKDKNKLYKIMFIAQRVGE